MKVGDIGYLSHRGEFTIFKFNGQTVHFRTSPVLVKYLEVLRWEKEYGYLEVLARYNIQGQNQDVEDYIDLLHIFEDLMLDKKC